jgi:Domain of unknown function (DUF4263)
LTEFEDSIKLDKTEAYWQEFFFQNQWIFGYGLDYKFLKIDTGQPSYGGINYKGKGMQRGDFLTHSKAGVNFTVLVEIKKPNTPLIAISNKGNAVQYRNGAWLLSSEVLGSVLQLQTNCKTWQRSSAYVENRELLDDNIYTVNPKGIIIIGCTTTLLNKDQIESFEGFRRGLTNIEIVTFDEVLERAKHVILGESFNEPHISQEDGDDLPF